MVTYRFNTDGLALRSIEIICTPCQFLKVNIFAVKINIVTLITDRHNEQKCYSYSVLTLHHMICLAYHYAIRKARRNADDIINEHFAQGLVENRSRDVWSDARKISRSKACASSDGFQCRFNCRFICL